jgi:hypothetical protein
VLVDSVCSHTTSRDRHASSGNSGVVGRASATKKEVSPWNLREITVLGTATHELGARSSDSEEREVPEWETKLGKIFFYLTCTLRLWFFYGLNGI